MATRNSKDTTGRKGCVAFGAAMMALASLLVSLLLSYQHEMSFTGVIANNTMSLARPLRRLSRHLPGTRAARRYVRDDAQRTIGRRDYAFAADGARIIPDMTTGTFHLSSKSISPHPAKVILRDNLHGGRCWLMPSTKGQVGIVAAERLRPTHITIDHVPRDVADEIGRAPRRMRAWAYVEGSQGLEQLHKLQESSPQLVGNGPNVKGHYTDFLHMVDFEYDINATHYIQTFAIDRRFQELGLDYGIFTFEVLNNWGSASTCIYRIRIHGITAECESLHRVTMFIPLVLTLVCRVSVLVHIFVVSVVCLSILLSIPFRLSCHVMAMKRPTSSRHVAASCGLNP